MKIVKAKEMGFCMGVSRAIETLEQALSTYPNRKIVTLGPLIHNPQVLLGFKERGVDIIENPKDAPLNSIVVIRAHGIAPKSREILKERESIILDGTCPKVLASQKIVADYSDKGYKIIIVGDRGHGEVVGLSGVANMFQVIENIKEAEQLDIDTTVPDNKKILIVAQTTCNIEKFQSITSLFKKKYPSVVIKNTLCPATKKREDALFDLKGEINALLVIGGKNSANTTNLFRKGVEIFGKAWHIEDVADLPDEIFLIPRIGITAGASTSSKTVEKVIQFLKNRT